MLLINHNAVNVFVRVSIIGVAHISCHITVGQCNGILALYHNALAGIRVRVASDTLISAVQ